MRPLVTVLLAALVVPPTALPAAAQVFEAGDIVIPGNRVVDSWGNVHGCLYRLRGGAVTRWFESPSFRSPGDMIVDPQGRLVFWAGPASRNLHDSALFRIDPATGALERLFYFPYIVAPGDTLPDGFAAATSFYGTYNQALHLEKSLSVAIVDDENGGWPQVVNEECYGFSIGTSSAAGPMPSTFRYRASSGRCEAGVPAGLLPWSGPVFMADDGTSVYYGLHNMVGRTKPAANVNLHLDGDWGTLDDSLAVNPKNEIIVDAQVLDNTVIPNGTASCQPLEDDDVPYNGGAGFSVLSMSGLGVLDGSLYAISNSGGTGVPYLFDLAMRAPFLNPYICQYYTACRAYGPLAFWLEDGTPTGVSFSSVDGGALLGLGDGRVKRVTPMGGYEELVEAGGDVQFTGRPWRWPAGDAPPTAASLAPGAGRFAASADSGAQVLVVRADARVHVLLTDPLGRRIGFDAAGAAVNDFGESGQALALGPGGWPRVIALRDPEAATFTAEITAVEAGDWIVHAYLAHEGAGGARRTLAGSAAAPGSDLRGLHVGRPLELTWYGSPTAVGDANDARGGFASVGPVPARGSVRFACRVPAGGGRVRLEVFDLSGRRVAVPLDATLPAGTHAVDWNGTRADGRRVASGVYLARLDTGARRETRRIVFTD